MPRKLTSLLRCTAGIVLPLLAAATAHRQHHFPAPAPQPDPETTDIAAALAQIQPQDTDTHGVLSAIAQMLGGIDWRVRLLYLLGGAILGGLVGAFFSHRLRRFRRLLGLSIIALLLIAGVLIDNFLAFGIGAAVAGGLAFWLLRIIPAAGDFEAIFGNARPALRDEIAAAGHMLAFDAASNSYVGKVGIPLGSLLE